MSDRDWLSIKNLEIEDGMDGLKNDLSNSRSARNGTTQLWNTEDQRKSNVDSDTEIWCTAFS